MTGTGTGAGGNNKPGANLRNVIKNNPFSKAIDRTLDRIKDRLDRQQRRRQAARPHLPATPQAVTQPRNSQQI